MSTPSLRWQCVCVDASDPRAIASFWQEALGWRRTLDTDTEVPVPKRSRARKGIRWTADAVGAGSS